MIQEHDIEKAVDHLRDSAESCAKARAERLYIEEYMPALKSLIMKEHTGEPVAAQEREARADKRYLDLLEAYKEAVYVDEKGRFLRAAADAKISAWQTQQKAQRL